MSSTDKIKVAVRARPFNRRGNEKKNKFYMYIPKSENKKNNVTPKINIYLSSWLSLFVNAEKLQTCLTRIFV